MIDISALCCSDARGLRCGSYHGDLYFDRVDCLCDVIAAMGRAVKAALPAHALAAESCGSFACTLPGAILGPRAALICAID
jgi:hypothetical protein